MSWLFIPKYWSFSFSISYPCNLFPGLISFRIDWFDLSVQGTLKSLLQHHSSKASIHWHSAFFIVQQSHTYMRTRKTIALTILTFVGKVMSLLFNMLSKLVIAFFFPKEQVSFNFIAVITICSDFGAQENKACDCIHCFPIYLPWSDGTICMIFVFWMLNFKPAFSLSSFTFIERPFSSSSLSVVRVVSSVYLRLLIFLPAILIPVYASSSLVFCMMYSAYKLNKQGDNIEPWRTPFPIGNQSVVPCPVVTLASWPAYRFLKRQVRWSGILLSLRIFQILLWSTQSKALA